MWKNGSDKEEIKPFKTAHSLGKAWNSHAIIHANLVCNILHVSSEIASQPFQLICYRFAYMKSSQESLISKWRLFQERKKL